MSHAQRIYQGPFGRAALLDMNRPLVVHAHSQCHVLLKVGGEDTYFRVRDRLCPLQDQAAVLVNAWEPHCYAHQDEWPNTTILALYIEPKWLCGVDRLFASSASPRFFQQPCVGISGEIVRCARRIAEAMKTDEFYSNAVEGQICELMIAIIREHSNWRELRHNPQIFGAVADSRIAGIVNEMHLMLGDKLDVGRLAEKCGFSKSYFFEFFRNETNLTPAIYFNLIRMEEAHHRLTKPDQRLTDVALDLSFREHSHFTRFFREHQGICPSEYRRVVQMG